MTPRVRCICKFKMMNKFSKSKKFDMGEGYPGQTLITEDFKLMDSVSQETSQFYLSVSE